MDENGWYRYLKPNFSIQSLLRRVERWLADDLRGRDPTNVPVYSSVSSVSCQNAQEVPFKVGEQILRSKCCVYLYNVKHGNVDLLDGQCMVSH